MITYRTTNAISPAAIRGLFRRNEWWDWWPLGDVKWYLAHALFVVTAWHGKELVDFGALTGDGRINVHLNALLVDHRYRGKGIGAALVKRMVAKVVRLRPYSFQTDVYQESTERLYRRFGFHKNRGTWLLEHRPTAQRWMPQALADRNKRRRIAKKDDANRARNK